MNYFIIINDAQQGPFSVAELQQQGISSDTLVWTEGMAEWTPAWQVEELRPLFYKQTAGTAVPPPPPVNPGAGAQAAPQGAPVPPQGAQAAVQGAQSAQGAQASAQGMGPNGPQTDAMHQPIKPRHNGRWAIIVLVVVAIVLAFTNPSERAHKRAILSNVTNGVSQVTGSDDNSPIAQGLGVIGRAFASGMAEMVLNQSLEYHNYLFFSTTTLRIGSKDVRTSLGVFGNVFTADEDEVAKDLKDAISASHDSDDDNAFDDADDDSQQDPNQDVQVQRNEKDTTLTDGAGRAIGRAVVKEVTKTVKQKVDEATDSTTSNGISHIIDEIEKMLGM